MNSFPEGLLKNKTLFEKEFNVILKVPHYSKYIGKEKYREEVNSIINNGSAPNVWAII